MGTGMDFDADNLLDQFLQQNALAQRGSSFGTGSSHSQTPIPMTIPGSHDDGNSSVEGRMGLRMNSGVAGGMGTNVDVSEGMSSSVSTIYAEQQSRQQSISGNQIDAGNIPTSFMDEYVSLSNNNRPGPGGPGPGPGGAVGSVVSDVERRGHPAFEHINLDETTRNLFDEPIFQDGSQATDDLASSFNDDFVSSLGSSIHSDLMTPVSSYQPHPLNSFDSHSLSQMSSSLRSPSTSYRGTSQLSSSLRSNRGTSQQFPTSSSLASTPKELTGSSSLGPEEKIRRRREFHNAVERRRRELIKAKIKELGTLVPPTLLHSSDNGKKVKANKGTILMKTIDYMEFLKQVLEIQEAQKEKLRQRVHQLEMRKQQLANAKGHHQEHRHQHPQDNYHQHHNNERNENANVNVNVHVNDTEDYTARIIDGRAYPALLNERHDDTQTHESNPLHDDLQQFLSGTLMENEDNNKLMFNGHDENPVDILLKFEE